MFLRELDATLDHIRLRGVPSAAYTALARMGILNIGGLLCHYPRDYEDRSLERPLRDYAAGDVYTPVTVTAHQWFGPARNLKIMVKDNTARAALLCFRERRKLADYYPVGSSFRVFGKFEYNERYRELQSGAFKIEKFREAPRGILPLYRLSGGLGQETLRRLMERALELYGANPENELPQAILRRDSLLPKPQAIRAIHFPASFEELEAAKKTLIYEELFYLEIMVGKRALERRGAGEVESGKWKVESGKLQGGLREDFLPSSYYPLSTNHYPPLTPLQRRLIERLPFSLTPGQILAVEDINRDMDGPWPMARLLQGDVGSGKTLTAFLGMLRAVEPVKAGLRGQAVLMAPTELLARQHAETAAKLLEPLGLRIAFLSGNIKTAGRSILLKALAAGDIDIALGTHAVFSKDVIYRNLRMVVVDEQHRFGVTQRNLIMSKGDHPDLLMMSATPIPRTLAMTVFGDLDVSVIPDMPPGRKPVKTYLIKESNAAKVYNFVRRELAAGRQAYFVYPLIGSDETQSLKDAESMARQLSEEVFPEYPAALIHSRLEEEEKRAVMDRFRGGEVKVLAATSVVEVGVDVPNASCMVIEHAERFGLSALHQLRGRVGRGEAQSYCFLIYSDQEVPLEYAGINPAALREEERSKEGRRLMVMLENSDGFVIAEEDLKLRGPGQLAGLEQSGYLSLGIADLVRDAAELLRARADAFGILESDPGLLLPEHNCIARVLERSPPFTAVGM